MSSSEQLNLTVVSENDLGDYTCTAENSGGEDLATTTVALAGKDPIN